MWINVPSTTSPCVQAGPDSTLAWSWLWDALEQSVGSNGKRSPASTWRRLWKRAAWLKRLCGRICEPSMAVLGVESWIASLRATRASRSVSPANVVDKTIRDTFGPTSIESLAKLNHQSYFSKTCPATSASDLQRSPQTLKAWVTRLRRDCSQRRKSAQATSESGCSSSLWRSPTSQQPGVDVNKLVTKSGNAATAVNQRLYLNGLHRTVGLPQQAKLWQTIKASDGEKGGPNQRDGKGNPYLPMQAALWPTPDVPNGGRTVPEEQMTAGVTPTGRKVQKPLARTAELWPTPRAEERCQYNSRDEYVALSRSVTSWPTPSTRDYRTPNSQDSQQRRNADSKRGQQLCNFASHDFSLPAPTNSTDGEKCSKSTMHLPRLNPLFVCWLMGWPRIAPVASALRKRSGPTSGGLCVLLSVGCSSA